MKLKTTFLLVMAVLAVTTGLLLVFRLVMQHPEPRKEAPLRHISAGPKTPSAAEKKNRAAAPGTAKAAAGSVRQAAVHQVMTAKGKGDEKPVRSKVDPATALKRWEDWLAIYTAEEAKERVETTPVTVGEQEEMRELFWSLAPEAKLENINHAINLLPDETFPVIYGILLDTSQPTEVITALFHDLLNRDEAIKNPVMEEIVKDKSHPMYVESARILDIVKDK